MATIKKSFQPSGAHTAGIFADLSVDGPIIGTLVAIVDRAKNLPNRKTIGKQDPYCAARLGKEAKKTSTDIRGGQTPKWDQELRFTVHDSADYYQLKISVFTDDKKTDLIGESWIDLKNIIVPGGGQNDVWQNLSCKGKYAGEIRVEITYYDSRPKPEKAPVKARHSSAADLEGQGTPPKHKPPMKRRPLPSDPVTGEAPPANNVPITPEHHHTPPRHAKQPSHSAHISSQSPLQSVEYGLPAAPSHHRQQPEQYSQPQSTPPSHIQQDPYWQPDHNDSHARQFDQHRQLDSHGSYSSLPEVYTGPPRDSRPSLPPDDDRPPPPPVHRSRHNSQNSFDTSPTKMPMRHDVLRNEAHRNSAPSYPGQPTYRGFESAPPAAYQPYQPPEQDPSMPRHHSHDGTHELHSRAMQPTVEDAPESPTGPVAFRQSASRRPQPEDAYGANSPAPLSLSRSPGASPSHAAVSPMQTPGAYDQSHGHSAPVSPLAPRDFSTSPGQSGYQHHGQYSSQRREAEPTHFQSSASYSLPALPASLVPGVDPALSQEITDRIYEERRAEGRYSSQMSTPPRGRQQSEPPMAYGPGGAVAAHGYSPHGHERRSMVPYAGSEQRPQPHRQSRHSVSPTPPMDQGHTIRRKSVSPIPPSVEERRSSEVPFSPDSFDAFNPTISHSRESTPLGDTPQPTGKIITHDGKEVDPSDHLPVESWAPEPEPKPQSQGTDTRSRPMPGGAQPMPPSGRKQLRVARSQAQPAPSPSAGYSFSSHEAHAPPAPVSTGRNRLHKRTNRGSAVPSPAASSPLAPISPDNYQDRQSQGGSPYTPTRGLPRAHTWDYPSENHSPHHHQHHHGHVPPVPAKVPLMSGANMGPADERSLAEELQSIDIGAGRSRRRGGY